MNARIADGSPGIAMSIKTLIVPLFVLAAAGSAHARTCPAGLVTVAPDARYLISEPVAGQRVVTDRETNLIWKQCPQGLSGAACASGSLATMNWSAALTAANAESFAGASDWRLPTAMELRTLVETACFGPAINETVFPANGIAPYWSATPQALAAVGDSWVLSFDQGNVGALGRSTANAVRLVRGGRALDAFDSAGDAVPDAFGFTPQTNVPASSLRTSNAITVAGITVVTGIGISGAAGSQYRINAGAWTSLPGTVVNGDSVEVRHTSAATTSTSTTTTLSIGGLSADFVSTTVPDTSNLALALGDSPDPVVVGSVLTYTLTVTNAGPEAILASQTFAIRSALPAGLSGCSYTPSAGTFNVGTIAPGATGTGTWTGAALPAGSGSLTLTIACSVGTGAAASLSHPATVFPPTDVADPDCSGAPVTCAGNNTATAATTVIRPQLTLSKTASGSSFTVGSPASFTLGLANTGTAATTAASTITDTIPAGLTIGTLPAGCTAAGQTVSCTAAAGLAAAGNTSFVIPVNATVAAAASITNTATVSGGGDATCPANARCTSSVTVSIIGTCTGISFPYTLTGADNAARVANLRTAIQCANLNGSADIIDLAGQTLSFSDAFADYAGPTGLPQVTSGITLGNGTLRRDAAAPLFRLIAMNSTADLRLNGITLQGGSLPANLDAAAIRNIGGTLALTASSIIGNRADSAGAVYHEGGLLTIVASTFTGNTATQSLGVLTNANGTLRIVNSSFSGNACQCSANEAGVIYNFGGTSSIVGSSFTGNTANGVAGAIQNFSGSFDIHNSVFSGNSAGGFGGAIFNNAGTMNLSNSLVSGNRGGTGGGILNGSGGTLTIRNSTIAGNQATTSGGIHRNGGTLAIANSIVWGNNGNTLAGSSISHSIVEGGFAGTGNLDVDPLFVAPVGFASAPTSTGDYRLQSYSPATDAGNNAAVPVDTLDVNGNANTTEEAPDLAGNPRRYNDTGIADTGAGTAPIVDLGAYERQVNSVVPALTLAPTSLSVSEAGPTVDSFLLSLNTAPPGNVTVQLSFDGQVQVDTGSGYGGSPQTVTLTPANALAGVTVNVRAVDDALDESSPHTSTIVTSASSSANPSFNGLAVADVTVSVTDNDTAGILVSESAGTAVAEGGAGDNYAVVLQSQPTANVAVNIVFDPAQLVVGGETDGNHTLTFTAADWNSVRTVTVAAVDDTVAEDNPHASPIVQTSASADPLYAVINPADVGVSIGENDTRAIVFATASSSFAETVGTHVVTARLEVSANGAPGGSIAAPMSANVALTLGSAEAGDLTLGIASVGFAAGAVHGATQPVNLAISNDRTLEADETASLGLTLAAAPGTVGGPHALTISDDETGSIAFALSSSSAPEGSTPHSVDAQLTIAGSGSGTLQTEGAVSASLGDTPGSAGTPGDYTRTTASVSFAAGSASGSTRPVLSTIVDDSVYEGDENYTLIFTGVSGAGALGAGAGHLVTIVENEAPPVLSITSPSQDEGDAGSAPMNFVITLTPASAIATTFTAATANGSATTADNDYVALPATPFSIPAGQTSLTIPVTINGNTLFEGDETFSLDLTAIGGATPATLSGTGTIRDDDQQPTTTTIDGDSPDPSVVGQAYTVSFSVLAQSTSPVGSVTVSDGSASCTGTLAAGAAPASSGSCSLISSSAGTKTLTATYTPASTAFGPSSGTASHQVNPAVTTISVSGPARSRVNQPVSFSFVLGVQAPGAGTPTGTVTLSSGASSCTATLPATACNLSFATLGARTVSASYAGDGNFGGSASSGAGNAQTLVYALSDLSISKTDNLDFFFPEDLLVYTVVVRNLGPDAAANIRVSDVIPAGLVDVVWSCDASGGATCPVAGGAGNLDVTLASLPVGGLLNFTFYGNVDGRPTLISNTAELLLPADTTIEDPVAGNNTATDQSQIELAFADGFEDVPVNAPSGSVQLPALELARTADEDAGRVYSLRDADGEALRVYARLHGESLQYALATRASNGALRLGAWRTLAGEPRLSWTAVAVARGWRLQTAELR